MRDMACRQIRLHLAGAVWSSSSFSERVKYFMIYQKHYFEMEKNISNKYFASRITADRMSRHEILPIKR